MKKRAFLVSLSILIGIQFTGHDNTQRVLAASAQNTENSNYAGSSDDQMKVDSEIQKAIDLDFVPDSLQGDYDTQINYTEFCSILDNFISAMFPESLSAWEDNSANYRNKDELMSRMEGALVFLYVAESCGIDAVGYEYNIPLEDLIDDNVDFYEGVTWDYPLLPDFNQIYYNETIADSENYSWRCELDYADNAKRFVEYFSYGNGKTYFDYDERYSLNLGDIFTCGDAIRAVERLYENARFAQYVPANEVTCTVSDTVISAGSEMPVASWQELPEWKGYTIGPGNWSAGCGAGMLYEKELVEILSEQGFNFVRVPLDSRTIFNGSDMTMVNPAYLENMDDLIEYCAEAGIHVCLDLHDMPGFYTGGDDSQITLWDDKETQEVFTEFWQFLSEYYKDVPSNLLSFNLLNEPHSADGELSDDVYSYVMLKAIDSIREISPERLIFVDMLGVILGDPVQGLSDVQVVQTVHPYFLSDNTSAWPIYSINGFIHKDNGQLKLNGVFPAGTMVDFHIASVHSNSNFYLKADDTTVASIALGTEAVGENGCIYIGEEGTDGEFRDYEGVSLRTELSQACTQITLIQENGCWYNLDGFTITTEGYSVNITTDNNAVIDETVPVLSISDHGVISAQEESTLACKSREWLEDVFQKYQEFTEETGTLVMAQEFGFNHTIDSQAALNAADDFLSVLDEYNIPWCSWCSEFGPIIDAREVNWCKLWNDSIIRDDVEYKMVSDNWMIDTGMMEVYKKHMSE